MRGWNVEAARVIRNRHWAHDIWLMTLEAPDAVPKAQAGQFFMVVTGSGGPFLPRAMAPVRFYEQHMDIYYRVVGEGTQQMARAQAGDNLDVIGPLGTPFAVRPGPLALIGRGVGMTPLLPIAERARSQGESVRTYLSARSSPLLLELAGFQQQGAVFVHTDDQAPGELVTDRLARHLAEGWRPSVVVVSGAHRLMRAVRDLELRYGFSAWAFVEEKMACGIGWCQGCAIGPQFRLICQDGPALPLAEVVV
ncbi:MAG: hypothetical protein M0Z53_08695 [Thermaerobacter sp.]|nr:hypothetical protein [Thermaerobacter sp.]